jgi:hypothetical protein
MPAIGVSGIGTSVVDDRRTSIAGGATMSAGSTSSPNLAIGAAHHHGAFNRVLKMADVAWPAECHERLKGRLCQNLGLETIGPARFLNEVLRQRGNVGEPLTQRRQIHVDHIQAIEEILAEPALPDQVGQVLVAGGDDARVHLLWPRRANALEFALLNRPQHFGLQRQRHRRDLVDEQRAAIGGLEPAHARVDRARERALHVPEQLASARPSGMAAALNATNGKSRLGLFS